MNEGDPTAEVRPGRNPSQAVDLPDSFVGVNSDHRTIGSPVYSSKSDMVTAALRELILTGRLEGGAQLRQRDLAQLLGVSPTPVREALRRLEAEGMLVSSPHKGSTVVAADFGATETNYRIRAALESVAAELAADKITEEEIEELEQINDKLRDLPDGDEERHTLNAQFHFRIYSYARSPLIISLLRLLWRAFPGGPQAARPAAESVEQHEQLIYALRERDGARAAQVTREHILGAVKYLAGRTRNKRRPKDR